MSSLTIKINTENAAFADDPAPEIVRILRRLADRIESGAAGEYVPLMDVNGNKVGEYISEAN